jgi:anti-anti-sigma regulatory factor
MSDEAPVFVVNETGERTVIAFRDWGSARDRLFYLQETYVAGIRREVETITAANGCKVLAIDVTNVDVVPSSFLAVLVLLTRGGLQIELLHPSKSLLDLLEKTKLSQFFVYRDTESSPVRKATGRSGLLGMDWIGRWWRAKKPK